ncbi:hypothetical protein SAMN05660199_04116 [Klenkia soli]|uniref:DUF4352 domain-containing protein n=1 Tax=Klenkia soli TaxID=1052260 RepID=A0A1H0TDS6_9ACTN|nr:hypothetical protein [Klenkia soli]SDP52187.1 hypothetical protein SAMN05660199_04116 [Klenkia soli]
MTERGDGGAPAGGPGGWQSWGGAPGGGWPGQAQPGQAQPAQPQQPPGQPGWQQPGPQQQNPQQPWPQQQGPQQQNPQRPWPAAPGQQPQQPAPAGAWNPASGPAPWAVQPSRRSRRTPLLVGAAVLVLLLVAGGLFFLLRGDDLTYAGRTVADPQGVLDDAGSKLAAYADGRGGATSDDTGCWFEYRSKDTSDVEDAVVCGPVLFVDGDPSAAYVDLPLTPSTGSGDVTFEVGSEPEDPEPHALDDVDLLVRPDGRTPPADAGDLQVPEPPQAAADYSAEGPFDDVDLTTPDGLATLSGAAARVTVTGVGQADRVGSGDDAVRPADGEVFRVFRYSIGSGEGYANSAPTLSYVVDGGDPVAVDPTLVVPGATVEGLLSAPADADVQLVVLDDGVTQTLSLVDGSPGADNLQVTTRENRDSAAPGSQSLPGSISRDGASADATYTLDVSAVRIGWYTGTDITATPPAPDRAFLVIQDNLVADNASFIAGKPPSALYTLTLPDGTVVPGQNLSPDPAFVATAFDVPADFTTGTITFGGTASLADGSVLTFGETRTFPVSIPAG